MRQHGERRQQNERELFNLTLRMVAEKIPPAALGLLWTIHRMHGEWICPAHRHGETCCVDVLLEKTPSSLVNDEIDDLATIILAGYDITIETAGDRIGEVDIYLSRRNWMPSDQLKFTAEPDTLKDGIKKARQYAEAFPQVRSQ